MVEGKRVNSFIGTPYWMAPEVIENSKFECPYDVAVDIWSLGITALEIAQAGPPHADINPMRALGVIQTSEPPTLNEPEKWSNDFRDFLSFCLVKNPKDRFSARELVKVTKS